MPYVTTSTETSSVILAMPFTGGQECTIYYPSMPDGTRATAYMDSTWKRLLSFYESFLTEAIRSST